MKFHCTSVVSNESVTQATLTASTDDGTVSGTITKTISAPNDSTFQTGKDYDVNLEEIAG